MPVPRAAPADCAVHASAALCFGSTYSSADAPTVAYRRQVRRAVTHLPGITTVSLDDILCPRHGRCPPLINGILARYDGVHFTSAFSREVVPEIVSRAERAGVRFSGTPRSGQ